jgi:hypothetical protein
VAGCLYELQSLLYTDSMQRSLATQIGRASGGSSGTAKAGGPGRARLSLVLAFLLLGFAGFALGFHPVVAFRDLTCEAGTTARYVSVTRFAMRCDPNPAASQATIVPTSRYIGLFLVNVNLRLLEVDFLEGSVRGPG